MDERTYATGLLDVLSDYIPGLNKKSLIGLLDQDRSKSEANYERFLANQAVPSNFSFRPFGQQGVIGLGLDGQPLPSMPGMLGGRVGYRDGGFDIGVSGAVAKLPNNLLAKQFGPVDLGYSMPLLGGTLSARAAGAPKRGYDARLTYEREF
jgi:hypothetical protein